MAIMFSENSIILLDMPGGLISISELVKDFIENTR